jgi:hypothetical protein
VCNERKGDSTRLYEAKVKVEEKKATERQANRAVLGVRRRGGDDRDWNTSKRLVIYL